MSHVQAINYKLSTSRDANNKFGFPVVKDFSAFTGFITLTSGF